MLHLKQITPAHALYSGTAVVDRNKFQRFGSRVHFHIPGKVRQGKFTPHAGVGVFLGLDKKDGYAFIVYSLADRRCVRSRSVKFSSEVLSDNEIAPVFEDFDANPPDDFLPSVDDFEASEKFAGDSNSLVFEGNIVLEPGFEGNSASENSDHYSNVQGGEEELQVHPAPITGDRANNEDLSSQTIDEHVVNDETSLPIDPTVLRRSERHGVEFTKLKMLRSNEAINIRA